MKNLWKPSKLRQVSRSLAIKRKLWSMLIRRQNRKKDFFITKDKEEVVKQMTMIILSNQVKEEVKMKVV